MIYIQLICLPIKNSNQGQYQKHGSQKSLRIYFQIRSSANLMSAKITLDNITVKNTPSLFSDCIDFEVTFSTLDELKYPLNWKVIYVGSALNEEYDQVLEEFEIDPILTTCTSKFEISCAPPNAHKIPKNELLCVTALIITASYGGQQFIRVGYYVHNQLLEEMPMEQCMVMPLDMLVSKIKRTIISDKPRITKFNIQWERSQSKQNEILGEMKGNLDYYFNKISKNNEQDSDYSQKINSKMSERQTASESGDSQSIMKCQ